MNRKVKSFKQAVFLSEQCAVLNVTSVRSAVFRPWHRPTILFCYSFIALSIVRCSKSAQKFAVRVCQVATVVMETTQLVLSQFKKNIVSIENRIASFSTKNNY